MLRLHSRCAPNVIGGYIGGKVIQSLQFTQDVPTGFQDTSPPVSGEISRYKARLVAQGFAQKPGIDFTETFAPVAKTDSIRLLLAFAAVNNFEIHQVDIKSAFLNGKLEETIFMRQPKGFVAKGKEDWVWQLCQTLYGLRQSGRVWYQKPRDALLELGFNPSAADPCVFIRSHDGDLSIIFTHVDDLGIICNSVSVVARLKGELAKYFPISDLSEAHHLLGIKITWDCDKRTIALSQERYILDLLRKYRFDTANPVRTPLDTSVRLSKVMPPATTATDKHNQQEYRDFPYQSIVGSLMHAAVMTQPDIAHAVQQVAQFMSDPQPAHTGGKGWCTQQVHCKYIARKWIKYPQKTHPVHCKHIQNFPSQFHCSVPSAGNAQYIHSVPDHVIAVFPLGNPWGNPEISQRK